MSHEVYLQHFSKYIKDQTGIDYRSDNFFQLESRLNDVVKLFELKSIEDLFFMLQKSFNAEQKQKFIDSITNNETSFFRDTKVFTELEVLLNNILSERAAEGRYDLNIWSAASSTGQESITVAIIFKEIIAKREDASKWNLQILCTDICERALNKAKSGVYTQLEVQRGLPVKYLVKYFSKDINDRWSVNSSLLKHMRHKLHNLRNPLGEMQKFDLVLCRNVLIYQNVEGKKIVLQQILNQLQQSGYLIMGSGESLLGIAVDFEVIQKDGILLYKKKDSTKILAA